LSRHDRRDAYYNLAEVFPDYGSAGKLAGHDCDLVKLLQNWNVQDVRGSISAISQIDRRIAVSRRDRRDAYYNLVKVFPDYGSAGKLAGHDCDFVKLLQNWNVQDVRGSISAISQIDRRIAVSRRDRRDAYYLL